jgi:hypothetical protein
LTGMTAWTVMLKGQRLDRGAAQAEIEAEDAFGDHWQETVLDLPHQLAIGISK